MKFGRNKSRRRVTLKIIFVWLLSIAMSLPLSLMYSKVRVWWVKIVSDGDGDFVSGSGFSFNRWYLPNTRPALQINRFHHMFLHSFAGDAGNVRPDRSTTGRTKTEAGNGRLVQWLDGWTDFHSTRYVKKHDIVCTSVATAYPVGCCTDLFCLDLFRGLKFKFKRFCLKLILEIKSVGGVPHCETLNKDLTK